MVVRIFFNSCILFVDEIALCVALALYLWEHEILALLLEHMILRHFLVKVETEYTELSPVNVGILKAVS
jgi:hypothetical protein